MLLKTAAILDVLLISVIVYLINANYCKRIAFYRQNVNMFSLLVRTKNKDIYGSSVTLINYK